MSRIGPSFASRRLQAAARPREAAKPRVSARNSEHGGKTRIQPLTCGNRLRPVERVTGIEPAPPAWKAGALPLSYTRRSSSIALDRLRVVRVSFTLVDVFTAEPFAGNQLCVVPEPPPQLDTPTMQLLAQEIGFSETTFVTAIREGGYHVRIFTPVEEL